MPTRPISDLNEDMAYFPDGTGLLNQLRFCSIQQWDYRILKEYRAYTVGPDGHFINCEGFTAGDDTQAIVDAKRLVDGYDIELWSGDRFVILLKKKPA
jgi:hypothetical protein